MTAQVAAVATVQLRVFIRTVRGKATVAFPLFIGLFAAFMFTRADGTDLPAIFTGATVAPVFVAMLTVFNLGVLTCNQFAASGRGLLLELLQPVGERAMVRGRVLATTTLCVVSLVVAMSPLLVVLPRASLPVGLAITLGGVAVHLTLAPGVALLSAVFPKTADLSRLGREGQPHPIAHLLGFSLQSLAALPPAACIVVALRLLDAHWLAPLLTATWLAATVPLVLPVLRLAERTLAARRENLALVVAGR